MKKHQNINAQSDEDYIISSKQDKELSYNSRYGEV